MLFLALSRDEGECSLYDAADDADSLALDGWSCRFEAETLEETGDVGGDGMDDATWM